MDTLSTTPVLTSDLPAYVADLAARVDRLEQSTRPQRHREHGHASGGVAKHPHYGSVPSLHNP